MKLALSAFSFVALLSLFGCSGAEPSTQTDEPATSDSDLAKSGSTCSAADYKTITLVGKWYGTLVVEETTTVTDLTKLISDISSQAGSSQLNADITTLLADTNKLDTDSQSAYAQVSVLAPTNASVITTKTDADTAFSATTTAAAAAIVILDAIESQSASGLKSFEGELQSLLATFESLAPDYTKVANDLASTSCASKS